MNKIIFYAVSKHLFKFLEILQRLFNFQYSVFEQLSPNTTIRYSVFVQFQRTNNSVFGIRKILKNEYIRYSVFGPHLLFGPTLLESFNFRIFESYVNKVERYGRISEFPKFYQSLPLQSLQIWNLPTSRSSLYPTLYVSQIRSKPLLIPVVCQEV